MTKERFTAALESAQAALFLNNQWLGRIRQILAEEGITLPAIEELIDHAKRENRAAFDLLRIAAQEKP